MKRCIGGAVAGVMLSFAVVPVAQAGCLKGAMVGAVAGHFAHHHAVLGAIAGCAVGHHLAVKAREEKAAAKTQTPPPAGH